jgi:hypothetical protein
MGAGAVAQPVIVRVSDIAPKIFKALRMDVDFMEVVLINWSLQVERNITVEGHLDEKKHLIARFSGG